MNTAIVVSYIYDTDYTGTILSQSDRDLIWTKMRANALDVFDRILFNGVEHPLSFDKTSFGSILNSGIIISGLTFYENDPTRIKYQIERAAGNTSRTFFTLSTRFFYVISGIMG